MNASGRSLHALDFVNIFMADVRDGVGVYLSVYLLTVLKWDPSEIGLILALPAFVGILIQPAAGAFIDKTRKKRFLLALASLIIALSCLVVIWFPTFTAIALSQAAVGIASTVFLPCVAGITLGMVGHKLLPLRIGRNEGFNHFGNMIAAVVAVFISWYVSYEGIFYFSVFQCAAIIVAILMIRKEDIDHNLARSAAINDRSVRVSSFKTLFTERNLLLFAIAMGLFHFANGAMLPLLGQKIGITNVESSAVYLSLCIIIAQAVMTFVAPMAGRFAENGRKNVMLLAFILVPLRALLFAFLENKYALISLQVLDGIGAGIFGVVSILMMADLSKGSGHFNFLQGAVYTAMGLGITFSNIFAGHVVKLFGYEVAFLVLALIGLFSLTFFGLLIKETSTLGKLEGDLLPTS